MGAAFISSSILSIRSHKSYPSIAYDLMNVVDGDAGVGVDVLIVFFRNFF